MKRILFVTMLLAVCFSAASQQALGPGPGLVSPEINPDHSVTFRLRAPKAVTVQLQGDCVPGGRADLVERDGVWTLTTAPLEGELYRYNFVVDGQ